MARQLTQCENNKKKRIEQSTPTDECNNVVICATQPLPKKELGDKFCYWNAPVSPSYIYIYIQYINVGAVVVFSAVNHYRLWVRV